jgi:hypothetical protein
MTSALQFSEGIKSLFWVWGPWKWENSFHVLACCRTLTWCHSMRKDGILQNSCLVLFLVYIITTSK